MTVSGQPYYRAFFEELSRLGYVEGQNLGVERFSGEGRTERYAELVRNVVDTHPDLIVTLGARLSLDFKVATTTIPIVTIMFGPVALGLVTSIARPGGNITGVTNAGGFEIIGKRLGLLVEAMPKLSTVGYLASRPFWEDTRGAAAREVAKRAGNALSPAMLGAVFNDAEYHRVFTSMEQDRPLRAVDRVLRIDPQGLPPILVAVMTALSERGIGLTNRPSTSPRRACVQAISR